MLAASRERMRSRAFQGALSVLAAITLLWGWRKWSEPRYEGRGIRSWIEQAPWDNSSNSEAQQALRSFGPRAVPYLIEAVRRPQKWDEGWLAKIPRRYLDFVLDLGQQRSVRRWAMWRLQDLVREEMERTGTELDPTYPVADQVIPVWKHELRSDPELLFGVESLGSKMTNLAPEVRELYPLLNPSVHTWVQASLVLSETHDPALVGNFLNFTAETNAPDVRAWALIALGRNGFGNDKVAAALRAALTSTNTQLRTSAMKTSAYLNLCPDEVLSAIIQSRTNEKTPQPGEMETFAIVEPILRWRLDGSNNAALTQVEHNLSSQARVGTRLATAEILQRVGSAARPFLPALERMAQEQGAPFQSFAVQALHAIDPTEARRFLRTLPPPSPIVHATTGMAK